LLETVNKLTKTNIDILASENLKLDTSHLDDLNQRIMYQH